MIAIVGIGSNIERKKNVPRAVRALDRELPILRVSSVWESEPIHDPSDPLFYNAALAVESNLDVEGLKLQILRPLEESLGRVRSSNRNAPRPVDLDVLIMGQRLVDEELMSCLHLLIPAAEVHGRWLDPNTGHSLEQAADLLFPAWRTRPQTGGFHWVNSLDGSWEG